MKRTIKYRGKVDGVWWYVSPDDNPNLFGQFWHVVDRETVGQYTDLKDRQERDIYEGDIVISGLTGNTGKIIFTGYAFRIKSITGQWGGELRMFEFNQLTVIGNTIDERAEEI